MYCPGVVELVLRGGRHRLRVEHGEEGAGGGEGQQALVVHVLRVLGVGEATVRFTASLDVGLPKSGPIAAESTVAPLFSE